MDGRAIGRIARGSARRTEAVRRPPDARHGLAGRDPRQDGQDHVNRPFEAPRPDVLWVFGFPGVATWSGFAHVAFLIGAYARRIVGWGVRRTRCRAITSSSALRMVIRLTP